MRSAAVRTGSTCSQSSGKVAKPALEISSTPRGMPFGSNADVVAVVDVAQHGQRGDGAVDRLGANVHVLGRIQGQVHARGGGEVAAPQPARDHDAVGEHRALLGLDAGRAPVFVHDPRDHDALADAHAGLVREHRHGERGVAGVHVPVVGEVQARQHAVGRRDRPQTRDLVGVDHARLDAVLHGDVAGVEQLVDATGLACDAQRAAPLE